MRVFTVGLVLGLGISIGSDPAVGLQLPGMSTVRDSADAAFEARRLLYRYMQPPDVLSPDDPYRDAWEHWVAQRREHRPRFIRALDELGEWSARDEWIVGQRVMLRVEQEWLLDALRVAEQCRATEWWCRELEGFVLHQMGETKAAEAAFGAALEAMPPLERCFARDLLFLADEPLLARYAPGTDAKRRYRFDPWHGYQETACEEWAEVEARFWWLADPFTCVRATTVTLSTGAGCWGPGSLRS